MTTKMPPKELIRQFCRESSYSENVDFTAYLYEDEHYDMNVYDVIQKCIDWNNSQNTGELK